MSCHAPADERIRCTDQALVAVVAARQAAATTRRSATVVDLLVALASGEGVAAARLTDWTAALTRLADRAATPSPRLAGLDDALRWAAGAVSARPLDTRDLLAAATEIGGSELADALDAAGVPRTPLVDLGDDAEVDAALAETFGFDPTRPGDLALPCAWAVARARAAGGSATALAVALALEESVPTPADADTAAARLHRRLGGSGWRERAATHPDDAGVGAVAEAARRAAPGGVVDPLTLVQATLMAGGPLPADLLTADAANPEGVW